MMKSDKEIIENLSKEQLVIWGTSAGVLFATLLIPFVENAGLAYAMSIPFGVVAGLLAGELLDNMKAKSK